MAGIKDVHEWRGEEEGRWSSTYSEKYDSTKK